MQITNDQILGMMPPQFGLFGLLFAFMNRLQAAGDSVYEEITCKQWFLLACMNLYSKEAPTANDLAETMGCSRQNVKEILNALVKKEILVLKQDENDKRKQRIYLTSKQKRLAKKYQNKEMDFLKLLYDGISDDEIRNVFQIISRMEKNLTGTASGVARGAAGAEGRPVQEESNENNRNLHKSDRFYKKVCRMDQRGEWGRVRRIQTS
ncbi:MAG: winged helix-turn-helix transcriptional regulator [Treponema sp.]|nr:winged helix-turn-helix transcriptional regulator [Treponema sp.]